MQQVDDLKKRIFGLEVVIDANEDDILTNHQDRERFKKEQLEEILSALTNQQKNNEFVVFDPLKNSNQDKNKLLEESLIVLEEDTLMNKPKLVLYQSDKNTYSVYMRSNQDINEIYSSKSNHNNIKEKEHNYGLFIPSGVTVRRVSQNILGNGVLGRAFIGQNYIEILDSLSGNAYQEVLTHEVLHIIHPEKKEMEIRSMTRNYIGAAHTVYH